MNFLKAIFMGKTEPKVHNKFVRYGKGEFERFLFEITKGKSSIKVKSSFDFANDFVGIIAENIKEKSFVSGKIITSYDFQKDIESICKISSFSKRGNLFTAEILSELLPEQLKMIYDRFSQNFLLLNIKSSEFSLKVGKSLPKPGGDIKADFCSATLPLNLLDEFAWDIKEDFSKLVIKHILKITDIIVPPELKNDPARARIEAKRKGKIIRIIEIDGKETKKEIDLIA